MSSDFLDKLFHRLLAECSNPAQVNAIYEALKLPLAAADQVAALFEAARESERLGRSLSRAPRRSKHYHYMSTPLPSGEQREYRRLPLGGGT